MICLAINKIIIIIKKLLLIFKIVFIVDNNKILKILNY